MNQPKYEKPVFFPNLDALRFFCFLSVFFFHSFGTEYQHISGDPVYRFIKGFLFDNGNLGVNFFFVLSGFLITYLLLVEKERFSRIDIKKFYVRRVLRIWPLFYFCVFFGFVLFPLFKSAMGAAPSSETARPLFYLLFVNNFDFILQGPPDSSVLVVLWSVAIEEQFYLFWPIVIAFVPAKRLPHVFTGIILSSLVFRYLNAGSEVVLEHHTISCISDMTIGALGAYLIFFSASFKNTIERMNPPAIAFIYIAAFAVFFFRGELFHDNAVLLSIDRLIVSILFLLIILEQNFAARSFLKFKSLTNISRLGKYTYGLYCLHMIGILITATLLTKLGWNRTIGQVLLLEGGASLLITIALAYASYHLYEKKFLRLKERFALVKTQSSPRPEDAGSAEASVKNTSGL